MEEEAEAAAAGAHAARDTEDTTAMANTAKVKDPRAVLQGGAAPWFTARGPISPCCC